MQNFKTLRQSLLGDWAMSWKEEEEREKNAIYSGHLRLCQQPRAAHALRSDQNKLNVSWTRPLENIILPGWAFWRLKLLGERNRFRTKTAGRLCPKIQQLLFGPKCRCKYLLQILYQHMYSCLCTDCLAVLSKARASVVEPSRHPFFLLRHQG